ncbi:MAG: 2Fe-2S iron-sulfur cluster binding domain-containing protein [Gracilibacteraceae bacterium]|jgi:aerobic-type carbon monoxide dehydrogenase small subunit (CoxS/CutS family)|nr:2Fe-2S iron-sulfur cluster binding domain-containing protein [Gracilibacteraceae bacterium]
MAVAAKPGYSCPYCATSFNTVDDLKDHVLKVHGTEALPRPEGYVKLTVNGQAWELEVAPNWTLFYLLHDQLGYTGAKTFCDRGACGSCTVIIDGRPVLSCMTLAIECDGKNIETAEGIAAAKHPLIEAYVKHHAMQCGYCTPGFVVTAKALLDRNPDPTVEEIKEALAGNLCRCGTYPQHPIAIIEAAKKVLAARSENTPA